MLAKPWHGRRCHDGAVATLVLGTAQWGLAYGVTNIHGRIDDDELTRIVSAARELGVTHLDTAAGYGDAEERISVVSPDLSVTTKASGGIETPVEEQIRASLTRLRRSCVDRCLLHDWPELTATQRRSAVQGLRRAQDLGLVDIVGVSVYTEADLDACGAFVDQLSVAQVPVSVLDQRLDGSSTVRGLRERGWTIQARSALLQGVLADPGATPFADHPDVQAVVAAAEVSGGTTMDIALAYVAGRPWVDEVVVGATTAEELREVAAALQRPSAQDPGRWAALASSDPDLVDPRRWPR